MLDEDSTFRANSSRIEQNTANTTNSPSFTAALTSTTTVRIPVVVHVIYNVNKPQENISAAQIASQIKVLNDDFRKMNADANKVPSLFSGLASDTNIEFYLATTTPTGAAYRYYS